METSTVFGLLLLAALIVAFVVFVLPKLKKKEEITSTAAENVVSNLVTALRDSVPGDVHAAAIDALKTSIPAVTRTPITPQTAPVEATKEATPPPANANPYGTDNYGNPFHSFAERDAWIRRVAEQDFNNANREKEAAQQMATGPLSLAALRSIDKAYLTAMGEQMNYDPRMLVSGLFYGAVSAELGRDTFPEMPDARFKTVEMEKQVAPDVVQVVGDLARGGTAPWVLPAFAPFGGAAYIDQHKDEWSKGWIRVHGNPA